MRRHVKYWYAFSSYETLAYDHDRSRAWRLGRLSGDNTINLIGERNAQCEAGPSLAGSVHTCGLGLTSNAAGSASTAYCEDHPRRAPNQGSSRMRAEFLLVPSNGNSILR